MTTKRVTKRTATAKKVLPPATGSCRWELKQEGWELKTVLRVTVNQESGAQTTTEYEFYDTKEGGYRLVQPILDPECGEIFSREYVIEEGESKEKWTCTCPDAVNRPERRHCCKHIRALQAALPTIPPKIVQPSTKVAPGA